MKTPSAWTHPPLEQWTQGGPVKAVIERSEVDQLESASEARTGDAAAMGLFGFAIGTALLAWVLAGWAPLPAAMVAAVPALLIFAGGAEFIAGLFAFSRTRSWAGTALCCYGANNVVIAAFLWMQTTGMIPRTPGNMLLLAVDLFCIGYISLVLAAGALRLNAVYVLTTLALTIGYCLTGIEFLGASRNVGYLGGYFLLAACFFAFYAATANVINSAWKNEVLPMLSVRRA